ncbi:hypothetical protein A4249_01265 [Brevundimonas sp. GW460-12-10-14-LB2]|uniref:hypothetical protein n=1 Tax=Brevundimonas sp. GW460-12-10-14-LB2 TaxID=1827469 RepID=UPI0007BC949D|nr:hypothetical protein [Brevundimonas sp. GW460-12-10-14-LB2]ANC52428.1 hypothetical protein A4249_01265 [Brevundimonas sp. GW460-12-10-14-LB2]
MTNREALLQALVALTAGEPSLPPAALDEPEPSHWLARMGAAPIAGELLHALAVQDATPETLAFVRGAEIDEAGEELEFTPIIAYAVQAKPGVGDTVETLRAARRQARDEGVRLIADLIAQNRTLGVEAEVYAEVMPPARDDDVAFVNALPSATALIPIRILYTGRDAAS